MRGRNRNTLKAYAADYEHFGVFCAQYPARAIEALFAISHGEANARLHEYQASMVDAGLSPATNNRRISAIKSLATIARTFGLSDWTPEIRSLKSQAYRDTAGPGLDGTRALLKAAKDQPVLKAKRDAAMVRMLFDMALRREEVASLDLEHLELDRRRVFVLGKGKLERVPITLPVETCLALREWLDARGTICMAHDKPLFVGLAGPKYGKRLSGKGVWVIITSLGERVGLRVRPHGLRHASITAVLDATGDLRAAQRHGRHSSANTTLKYDDNRSDIAGKAAQTIASILTEG
jgi:integrase/recombinase XerC